jgi:hypothetical protein
LAVDLEGNLVALTSDLGRTRGGAFLSVWRGGSWQATRLDGFMPDGWHIESGNVTVDAKGRILAVADAVPRKILEQEDTWGHPAKEVFLLRSEDGGRTFECVQASPTCPEAANWLPNISRTGPNHDLRSPLILYTQGQKGEGCRPDDRTRVYAVWVR